MLSTAIFDQAADVLLYNQSFVIKAANVAEQHYHLDKFPSILAVGGEKASAVNYYFYLAAIYTAYCQKCRWRKVIVVPSSDMSQVKSRQ